MHLSKFIALTTKRVYYAIYKFLKLFLKPTDYTRETVCEGRGEECVCAVEFSSPGLRHEITRLQFPHL